MERDCGQRLRQIAAGFRACRGAFTALGDETRQLILLVLLEGEPTGVRVGEIAQKAHLTRPSVSHHLQILRQAGLVAVRREGTKNYYYLRADQAQWGQIAQLIALVQESVRHPGGGPNGG